MTIIESTSIEVIHVLSDVVWPEQFFYLLIHEFAFELSLSLESNRLNVCGRLA